MQLSGSTIHFKNVFNINIFIRTFYIKFKYEEKEVKIKEKNIEFFQRNTFLNIKKYLIMKENLIDFLNGSNAFLRILFFDL